MEITKVLSTNGIKEALIKEVLTAFINKGVTPLVKVFRSDHYEHVGLLDELDREQILHADGDRFRIPLVGLTSSPAWTRENRITNAVLKDLDEFYKADPTSAVLVEKIGRNTVGVQPEDIQRSLKYLREMGIIHGTTNTGPDGKHFSSVTPDEKVRAQKSFEQLISEHEQRRKSWMRTIEQEVSKRKPSRWESDSKLPIYSDRNLHKNLQGDIDQCVKEGLPISVLFLDLDHFKKVNDEHDHSVGDKVLIETAALIRKIVGNKGEVIRNGGEEIVCILPNSDLNEAKVLAERICKAVSLNKIQADKLTLNVTVSIGVQSHTTTVAAAQIIKEADTAMYKAKKGGRNRVEVFS
jgi:diguanylate cyclase (GGDEF)-like protein